jgi:hypothetical protein
VLDHEELKESVIVLEAHDEVSVAVALTDMLSEDDIVELTSLLDIVLDMVLDMLDEDEDTLFSSGLTWFAGGNVFVHS